MAYIVIPWPAEGFSWVPQVVPLTESLVPLDNPDTMTGQIYPRIAP